MRAMNTDPHERPRGAHAIIYGMCALILLAASLAAGCRDSCDDVLCAPTPPALQVVVSDTITVDTQLVVLRGFPAVADTIDTAIVVRRPTSAASVTLRGARDTVAFASVPFDGSVYTKPDLAGVPDTTFLIVAERGGRRVVRGEVTVRRTTGCCAYAVIGYYRIDLPDK